jgi:formylglycine-generating enzyme required for sulfatase activity
MRAVVRLLPVACLMFGIAAFAAQTPPRAAPDDDSALDADDDDADEAVKDEVASDANAKTTRAARPKAGCPTGMARVDDFCMDRYEAPNRRGAKPLVMQTSKEAEEWCAARKKRLCGEDEWIEACEGSQRRQYPYGESHEDGRCNDDKEWRTVDEKTLAKWPADDAKTHTKELYQAAPSGMKKGCKSTNGVYDLTGNVEEWVVRKREHANDYHHILIGCYWSGCYGGGKPTCKSTNAAHGPGFRFYETGFRCCKDTAKREKR